MELTIIAVAGVIAVVAVAAVSQRIAVAASLSLVVAGIGLSFLPGLPKIDVDRAELLAARSVGRYSSRTLGGNDVVVATTSSGARRCGNDVVGR